MVVNLRNLVGNISSSVKQIAGAAERLSNVATQTSSGIHTQKSETEQVASAMNEMVATVQEVARNAQQAQRAALVADQQACAGEDVVGQVIEQIERQAIETGKSTAAMSRLKEQSDKIGTVLDVIRSVAMQTNLLALNAAIEAARAGDSGRGFAVVADEVRSLAQRTQQSTEEIEELIISLQDGTAHVVSVMETSRALTASSVDLTRQAGSSLEEITRTVSTIQQMNLQIATAAEQQALVAHDINRSVLSVRDITQRTASASDHTASSSVELANLGKQLEHIVKQFQT
ncbi:methyl-accepting chemotaxis protein [Pseudomonas sp. PB120]|uniref:methyl-accepting chemotaxis protein n=1 Tax=Pseudomonas sp. PB120 TaxID=2494700 RepID=UPI0035567F1C